MSTAMDVSSVFMIDLLAPLMSEVSFFVFFALGYLLLRVQIFPRRMKPTPAKKVESLQARAHKTIQAEVNAGHMISALKAWRAQQSRVPTQFETLKLVVKAMLEVEPASLLREITGHMAAHSEVLCNPQTAAAVLNIIAEHGSGDVSLMEDLHKVFSNDFRIRPYTWIYEVLLGGFASAGDEKRVAEIISEMHAGQVKVSARGYALAIKGFLKKSMLDASLKQTMNMYRAGYYVPPLAVTHLIRTACEADRGMETFNEVRKEIQLTPEATALLLEERFKKADLCQAREIEQLARQQACSPPLLHSAYVALLKNCIHHNDVYALELLEEMKKENVRLGDRLCVVLLSRCAETKFVRFAQEIVQFVRSRDGMNLSIYSALMKVYAFAGMYDKACDLYHEIVAQGMEPDTVMYGCLMKFAVECGRTDLSRELFSKVQTIDMKHYMSLIRAAGRDKDVERAFQVLQNLKEKSVTPDLAAYNCVLDVCVSVGDLQRARELIAEIRSITKPNIITYNTFLKGLCALGDIAGAKEIIKEMESVGVAPNEISYNCLINAAVSKGFWQGAWDTISMMETKGIKVDHYTLSIVMKALRKSKDSTHLRRALTLLDQSGVDVYSDEVLLSTVLETCIRHHELSRLEHITGSFIKSNLQPGVHTYGSLIKACGILRCTQKSWEFWFKMVDERALVPNAIVLGCMLDALVCNAHVEEAVSLFKKWQSKVPPNTIMYSVLIKGFTNSREPSRAMDMWREMRDSQVPMTTAAYNGVIDAHARLGLMDEVSFLVENMEKDCCALDSITYSTIVKGYCLMGNLDKAFDIFSSMKQNQMVSGSVIYNVLLDGCIRQNRMDLADDLLEDMQKSNITLTNFTLGILVKMWGRRKQLDKAFEVFREVPRKHGFTANTQTKTSLMCACLNNHDLDAAFRIFDELRSNEQTADWKTYTCMVSGLLRHGRTEEAVDLVKDAYLLHKVDKASASSRGRQVETDCLEQLLRALVQQGQMASVGLPLLNQLRASGVPISGKLLSTFTSTSHGVND